MSSIYLPSERLELKDGYIVVLKDYPGVRWLTRLGWIERNGAAAYGWYFISLLDSTQLVLSSSLVEGIQVVATDGGFPIGIPATPCSELASRAWESVATLDERDELTSAPLADGKVVRVGDVDGSPKMYIWNAIDSVWEAYEEEAIEDVR